MNKLMRFLIVSLLVLCFTTAMAQDTPVGNGPNKKLYDFNYVDTDFDAVFRSLAVTAGVDILVAPDVQGKLTLQVTKKSWQETLDIICNIYELTWLVEDKYITVQRSSSYQAKQKKIAEEEAQVEQVAPLVRKNFQIRHAKADELVKVLESMKTNRGRITTVDRSNSIIVYDTENSVTQMANALAELDVETLQIMITAKLVVVDSKLARELGVDWTASMGTTSLTPGKASTPTGSSPGASRTSAAISSLPNKGVSPAVAGASTAITASVLDNNLQIALTNIMGDASTEVLASPQVSTLDNTEALIFMGDKISIRLIDDNGESSTQLVETGIKLTVTPHVSGDNRILLDLHPENNSYSYDEKGEVVISTQEAKTKAVVADGETVIIGGLTKNEDYETESGIPFLMDIPVLGNLFKYSKKEVSKKDLVIFVTPRIIHNYIGNLPTSEPTVQKKSQQQASPAEPVTSSAQKQPSSMSASSVAPQVPDAPSAVADSTQSDDSEE